MKPKLSFAQLWNMNFGFLGIQFGWGLQLANISAIYAKLGADPDKIPLLWLAGPVTGLIVQPIVGAMSDRTWGRLGRRRPYFLAGSILATVGLFFLPNVHSLMAAAALLWVLDASINVSMEPFRAFVADKVNDEQRTVGFVMQSFFIGIGATMANLLPYAMRRLGVEGATASGVPLTVLYSFRLGAVVLLLAVLWTVCTSNEYPPEASEARGGIKAPLLARGREAAAEVFAALREMPATMKQLALVQIFTWLGLFCMWMYFGLMTATNVFGASDPKSPAFDRGVEWGGVCFAAYSIVCFAAAFALPKLAERVGRKTVHAVALAFGGASLLAVRTIHDPKVLLLTMVGVGVAWASILSMPYAILSGSLEPRRFGVFMGIFNFFIVLPEMIAALTFRPLVKYAFHNSPVYVVMLGGACLLVGAVLVVRVVEEKKKTEKATERSLPPEPAPDCGTAVPLEPAA